MILSVSYHIFFLILHLGLQWSYRNRPPVSLEEKVCFISEYNTSRPVVRFRLALEYPILCSSILPLVVENWNYPSYAPGIVSMLFKVSTFGGIGNLKHHAHQAAIGECIVVLQLGKAICDYRL